MRTGRVRAYLALLVLGAFFSIVWTKGFGPEDHELFRMNKSEVAELREAQEAAAARDQIDDTIV